MQSRNLIIYCDESTTKGKYFSHFYGGALIREHDQERVEKRLQDTKAQNNLFQELKWTKITAAYKDKYISFISQFFDLVEEGFIKVRIMFTQNSNRATNLEEHQIDNEYFLLYYQLIKHAFGLMYCGEPECATRVSLFMDDIPKSVESFQQFKIYVETLSSFPKLIAQRVTIPREQITSVDSKAHAILQGLDIVLGAMQFRLNDLHLEKPAGTTRRAKRTVAKEAVYKYISARIRRLYPGFNIGTSTSIRNDIANRWHHPYRHWLFVPTEHTIIRGVGKKAKKRAPPTTSP